MKVFDVPRGSRIRVIRTPETGEMYEEVLQLQYCDGVYALCYSEQTGKPVHIDVLTEVNIMDEER